MKNDLFVCNRNQNCHNVATHCYIFLLFNLIMPQPLGLYLHYLIPTYPHFLHYNTTTDVTKSLICCIFTCCNSPSVVTLLLLKLTTTHLLRNSPSMVTNLLLQINHPHVATYILLQLASIATCIICDTPLL
jgi:hypothetical protein